MVDLGDAHRLAATLASAEPILRSGELAKVLKDLHRPLVSLGDASERIRTPELARQLSVLAHGLPNSSALAAASLSVAQSISPISDLASGSLAASLGRVGPSMQSLNESIADAAFLAILDADDLAEAVGRTRPYSWTTVLQQRRRFRTSQRSRHSSTASGVGCCLCSRSLTSSEGPSIASTKSSRTTPM